MKYTRNRQLNKIHSLMESPFALPIEVSKKEIWNDKLDQSFKWHRDFHGMNIVSFNRKGESFKTYVIKGRK
ncbi:hypothetical protein [Bacillus mycoides]|uniref:hypothetical protein n=1 Tax=Bacillus mycoides TaxID=1405 RepID=UPI00293142AE|nr:hypothetical protein [Bacillus mycoides]WOA61038.1 hypothetical protein RVY74_31810 [Bacillus mycoides]